MIGAFAASDVKGKARLRYIGGVPLPLRDQNRVARNSLAPIILNLFNRDTVSFSREILIRSK